MLIHVQSTWDAYNSSYLTNKAAFSASQLSVQALWHVPRCERRCEYHLSMLASKGATCIGSSPDVPNIYPEEPVWPVEGCGE